MLLDLKKASKISDSTYIMLKSSDGLCPRFYDLPKVHKPGIQLRPIVSFVNSPTYASSCYLVACCWEYRLRCQKFLRIYGFHKGSGNVCFPRLPGSCQIFEVK